MNINTPVSCNSWIVTDKQTGHAIFETRSQSVVDAVGMLDKYRVQTAYDYLIGIETRGTEK